MNCPYCGKYAELVTGDEVYPHRSDLSDKKFWVCWDCDARVGCHNRTNTALGTMADAELRGWRMSAHSTFDPLWKTGKVCRSAAYQRLANALSIPVAKCHIGTFGLGQCKSAIEACLEGRV